MTTTMNDHAALKQHLIEALAIADRLGLDIAAIHIDDALTLVPDEETTQGSHMIDYVLRPNGR